MSPDTVKVAPVPCLHTATEWRGPAPILRCRSCGASATIPTDPATVPVTPALLAAALHDHGHRAHSLDWSGPGCAAAILATISAATAGRTS